MVKKIINCFKGFVVFDWTPKETQVKALDELVAYSLENGYTIKDNFYEAFIEAVNQKLDINARRYQSILDTAFFEHIKFNYLQKVEIRTMLDKGDKKGYLSFLIESGIQNERLENAFIVFDEEETRNKLKKLIKTDGKYINVLNSIFSRFCFNLFDRQCVIEFFSQEKNKPQDYFLFIADKYPDMCDRHHAMTFLDIDSSMFSNSYEDGCNKLLATIKNVYLEMNNHCEMIVYIPQIKVKGKDIQWRLFSDVILYAEKHVKETIDRTYFRWKKIRDTTKKYIDSVISYNAEFEYAYQGFVFKDCFVIEKDNKYDIMLVFEKNKRDERIVNCPACFSRNIHGNSYPILNVKSWECENPLCPDRSKYNRGKRYAFMSLFRQYQLHDEENKIPESSIARWHLDCVENGSKEEAFEMAIRHYSCIGDTVDIYGKLKIKNNEVLKRSIIVKDYIDTQRDILSDFKNSSFFYRYIHKEYRDVIKTEKCMVGKATIIHGDSYDALRGLSESSIDAAVTSPPYYNAKLYSQWNNIYCYLYDMYNISREIYRVLKEGGVYLFNIFDYFDNENNIVLSAMGDKRMILGAYMIDIFRRVGFEICGNIIWNKGEIQGNRSFNQGNMTPYYQAPLNCWEHVFILSKGKMARKYEGIKSRIEHIRPVVKMVRGKNILGHDAPYPKDIPEIIIKCLNQNDTVLDPFLGSGTTSVVANEYNVASVGIEKNDEYYKLCKKLIINGNKQQRNWS